ncbi:DUF885 domain-containing protein [Sphingomonas mesophila]|uniref:DUF885 domain-containing protein n=1 Tax=Sphingomonas mesophila TaxID=2303576 RepID=UPI000E5795E6|nr:DUF885 domain-containing protein [Sphingomonas mesophila]
MRVSTPLVIAALLLSGCATLPPTDTAPAATPTVSPAISSDQQLDSLADRMVAETIAYDPTTAYFVGVKTEDHGRWGDRSPAAIAAFDAQRDALLAAVAAIPAEGLSTPKRLVRAAMIERLEADRATRVCRYEQWDVNHMSGWHLGLADVAREQPVATERERALALERWSKLPAVVAQEIANARRGLAAGFSAPKPVVRRVMKQIDGIVASAPDKLPYYAIAERSTDPAFKAQFRALLNGPLRAAFRAYGRFLTNEYLPRARDSIAISAHPDGRACYAASLRSFTTLKRSPEEVFKLGQETVNGNLAAVRAIGREAFGSDQLPVIVKRINEARDNRFSSEAELIAFSRAIVDRARERSARLFERMPAQQMLVEPLHAYRRGTGASAYYERQIDPARPAYYRIPSERWDSETRGGAEITAVHEGYPGHHMQIALAASTVGSPIAELLFNSAYPEGWARYSEALAEEAGIYQTTYARMTRRLWPARGMVVDPGLHLMGWSREQAVAFIRESGRFAGPEAEDLIDRIVVWPGQLTAYDSGALEIFALRREAERALGRCFDLREFHARVLETGIVPLVALRGHIEQWIAARSCPAG